METFGSFLREKRLAKDLGLRTFAKMVDILPSNLSSIEANRANPPRQSDVLRKIASVLGFSEDSEEWEKLFQLATKPGQIPVDVQDYLSEINAVEELPLMARTMKNQKLTKEQIRKLISDLKKS